MEVLGNTTLPKQGCRLVLASINDNTGKTELVAIAWVGWNRRFFITTTCGLGEGEMIQRKRLRQLDKRRRDCDAYGQEDSQEEGQGESLRAGEMQTQNLHEANSLCLQHVHEPHRPRPEAVLVLQPNNRGGERVLRQARPGQAKRGKWGWGRLG